MAAELDKIEIPEGFSKEDIEQIIQKWDEFNVRIDHGEVFSNDPGDWVYFDEYEDIIERWHIESNAEILIYTITNTNETYVSSNITLLTSNKEYNYTIDSLKQLLWEIK